MSTDSKSILLVDDDPDIRDTLSEFLEYLGFAVDVAANGRDALDILDERDNFACILLDLMMPVMDGYAFRAAQLDRPDLRDIPVFVITARAAIREEEIGVSRVFRKPVDLDELVVALEDCCAQQAASPEI